MFLVFDNASNRMELPLPGSPGVKWDKRFSALDFYHSLEEGIKVGSFKRRIWTYAGDARELSYLPTLLLLAFGLRAIARRGAAFPHPATPHSAFIIQHSALTPPPPAMKRLALLLPLLATSGVGLMSSLVREIPE